MSPIKFWLNPTYGLGGDVVLRISCWPPWRPSWILERNDFSNSESLSHWDASHQVLLNPTYGLEGDVVWRILRFPQWRPSWISERNNFINFESLYHCDASYQVSAQSNLRFGSRCCSGIFNGGHLGHRNGMILAILSFCVTVMPPIKFQLNRTYDLGEISFEEFQDGHHGGHAGYRNGTILAILILFVTVMSPIKFWLNPTRFGIRCRLKNFKMAAVLNIETERF